MSFFDRLANGFQIALNSFKVLRANKQLILFPVLSGVSLILVMGSFVTVLLAGVGWDIEALDGFEGPANYLVLFLYYLVNYFVITFFNTALVYCTQLYFNGEEVTIRKGINFSLSRIGVIFSWALFAATVGFLLRMLQENLGWVGKIITSVIGIVWSIASFFVLPVIAFEGLGPIDAFKRSTQLMREKWGESLGSRFGFGIVQLIAFVVVAIVLFFAGSLVDPVLGVVLALLGIFVVMAIMSAAQTIFLAAVYLNVTGNPNEHFNQKMIDDLFQEK